MKSEQLKNSVRESWCPATTCGVCIAEPPQVLCLPGFRIAVEHRWLRCCSQCLIDKIGKMSIVGFVYPTYRHSAEPIDVREIGVKTSDGCLRRQIENDRVRHALVVRLPRRLQEMPGSTSTLIPPQPPTDKKVWSHEFHDPARTGTNRYDGHERSIGIHVQALCVPLRSRKCLPSRITPATGFVDSVCAMKPRGGSCFRNVETWEPLSFMSFGHIMLSLSRPSAE